MNNHSLSLKEYEEIVEHAAIMIWRSAGSGKRDYFNRLWLSFRGRTQEQEEGDGWTEGVHPEDIEQVLNIYRNACARQELFEMEYRILHYNGEYRWIFDRGVPFRNDKGNFSGYIGSCIDVTERVAAQVAFIKEEQMCRALFNQASDYVLVIDPLNPGGPIVYDANDAACNMHGYTREEFIGKSLSDLDDEKSKKGTPERMQRLFAGEKLVFEVEHLRKDGTSFPIEVSAQMVQIAGKTYIFSIERDITERRNAEEALRRSESFIKSILGSIGQGVVVIDPFYRIVTANRAYIELMQRTGEDVVGKHCYEVSHHIRRPCFEIGEACPTKKTFETGEPSKVVHTHTDSAGNPLYVEIRAYPMIDKEGQLVSVIETITDITLQRRLEEQLRNAQKLEAVGQLAGGIAHDFNNILTAIIGYGNLLQMKMTKEDPLRSKVDEIVAAAERAAKLTHSLLAYSRRQIINPQPVDLNGIIRKIEMLLSRLIGADLELRMELAEGEIILMADQGQVEQVLMNLATNARDAMPQGGLLLISTERVELDEVFTKLQNYGKPGKYALISISDNGMGMDEKTREKIFDPFFTTKEVGKGTGLGLAMVYGIARQHDGYVDVKSEPGKGTTFMIYLPMIEAEPQITVLKELPIIKRGSETVLIAEDDEAVRRLSQEVLEKNGYTVIQAADGEEALNLFMAAKDRIDILLLDVVMPKKDGKAVYDEASRIRPGIKAIFLSGYTADIMNREGVLAQGLNFIHKPISVNDLLRKVRQVLDQSSPGNA